MNAQLREPEGQEGALPGTGSSEATTGRSQPQDKAPGQSCFSEPDVFVSQGNRTKLPLGVRDAGELNAGARAKELDKRRAE